MADSQYPTRTWYNPRFNSLKGPDALVLRAIFEDLSEFLRRPYFTNGIQIGNGTPGSKDPVTGIKTPPPTVDVDSENGLPDHEARADALTAYEQAVAAGAAVTALDASISAEMDALEARADALETDPISFTRITDVSIETPHLAANAVTADKLASVYLSVSKFIASSNYSPGLTGWAIDGTGNAEFNNITVRGSAFVGGNISAAAITGSSFSITGYDVVVNDQGLKIASFPAGGFGSPESNPRTIAWIGGDGFADVYLRGEDNNVLRIGAPGGVVLNGPLTLDSGQVSRGGVDSGGAGFRLLRVPN